MKSRSVAMLVPCLALAACGSLVDKDLGKAQAHMVKSQVYDPSTLEGPQDKPVVGMDADAAKAAIDGMRKDVPDRTSVQHDTPITVGTKQGGGQ